MTIDNVKDFLLQYTRAQKRVRRLSDQIERLRETEYFRTSKINENGFIRHDTGTVIDTTGSQALKLIALNDKWTEAKEEALEAMDNVVSVIDLLPDPIHSQLLFDRYIVGMSWYEVANDIGYDPSHTRGRLHAKALEAAGQVLLNETDLQNQ